MALLGHQYSDRSAGIRGGHAGGLHSGQNKAPRGIDPPRHQRELPLSLSFPHYCLATKSRSEPHERKRNEKSTGRASARAPVGPGSVLLAQRVNEQFFSAEGKNTDPNFAGQLIVLPGRHHWDRKVEKPP